MRNDCQIGRDGQVIRPKGDLVIRIERITKEYEMGYTTIRALKGVDLSIHRNEYLAIMGPSGSGKSTLMNMLGCLDTPTTGRYEFNGRDVAAMGDDELAEIRNQRDRICFPDVQPASAFHWSRERRASVDLCQCRRERTAVASRTSNGGGRLGRSDVP